MFQESRRRLLALIGLSPIFYSSILFSQHHRPAELDREFVVINGWILMNHDLRKENLDVY